MASPLDMFAPNLENVRIALATALRERVIGDNAEEKSRTIMLAEGPRWFAEDRPVRRVHSDASMFIGGIRALLLQSLHPLAMAGVAQHSDFRNDPWGRLQRTADFLAITTFGTAEMADNIIELTCCDGYTLQKSTVFSPRTKPSVKHRCLQRTLTVTSKTWQWLRARWVFLLLPHRSKDYVISCIHIETNCVALPNHVTRRNTY
jgi:hypothetical protein